MRYTFFLTWELMENVYKRKAVCLHMFEMYMSYVSKCNHLVVGMYIAAC